MHNESLDSLLQQLQTGSSAALEELYRRMSSPVYTLILRMTGNTALSEDILQEFFVKLYRCPPAVLPRNPQAYLYRTAHNLTIDWMKKESRSLPLSDDLPLHSLSGIPSAEHLDLERALATLSPPDREIVTLHAGAGLKFREIAEIMAMPLGTVLWRYQRAIGQLRDLLNGGTL